MNRNINKQNDGGRPEKSIKRQRKVTVRFTNTEYFIATTRASKAKISLSQFIRESTLQSKVKAKLSEDDRHFFRSLTGLANNINQMAKLAHQEGLFSALAHFKNILETLDKALKKFRT